MFVLKFGKIAASFFRVIISFKRYWIIHLRLIQSPWRRQQHDCPKFHNSVMIIHSLTTQKSLLTNTRLESLKYCNVYLLFIF